VKARKSLTKYWQTYEIEFADRSVAAIATVQLLVHRKSGLVCPRKCPGDVILKTYDFARLEWQKAIDAGRFLLLSPFRGEDKRVTTKLATERNRFVAAISNEVLIPYAAPGSKTEELALSLLAAGKPVCTFNERPGSLLDAGANVIMPDYFASRAMVHPPVGGEQ
jgi:hypothetical protein